MLRDTLVGTRHHYGRRLAKPHLLQVAAKTLSVHHPMTIAYFLIDSAAKHCESALAMDHDPETG